MSITLSIPPAIVQEVREWAEANGTSLNQYVRDCLAAWRWSTRFDGNHART